MRDLWDTTIDQSSQDYWSLLDGDEYGTWVDARLTDLGISQAKTANAAWAQQIEHGIPSPQSYYVSPLNRCLETGRITFEGLSLPDTDPFRPLIQEVCYFMSFPGPDTDHLWDKIT